MAAAAEVKKINLGFETVFSGEKGQVPKGTPATGTACEESCFDPEPACEVCFEPPGQQEVTQQIR